MPLHLLGISPGDEAAGLGTVPFARPSVHWVREGSLAAATAPAGAAAMGPLDHARLLAAIFEHINILPARFGAVLPDEGAVRHFLRSHGDALCGQIDCLRGGVEMALRIDLPHLRWPAEPTGPLPDAPSSAPSPADYLASRRANYRRQDRLVAQAQWATDVYLRALKGLFRQWRRRSPEPPGTLRLAFLVPREQAAAFAERVALLRAMQIGQPSRLFGPWPPYSFI
jgi:hypothetical protein